MRATAMLLGALCMVCAPLALGGCGASQRMLLQNMEQQFPHCKAAQVVGQEAYKITYFNDDFGYATILCSVGPENYVCRKNMPGRPKGNWQCVREVDDRGPKPPGIK